MSKLRFNDESAKLKKLFNNLFKYIYELFGF